MGTLGQELRFALRMIAKAPGQTAVFALVLGVGIGLNVSIFTLLDQLVLKPPAARDLDRLVVVTRADPKEPSRPQPLTAAEFLEWRAQARSFQRLVAWEEREVRLGPAESVEMARAGLVTAGYFALLDVAPALGRTFGPDEEETDAPQGQLPPVILGHDLWQRRFVGDANVVGMTLMVDGRDHVVVGVMPPAFGVPRGVELWQPRVLAPSAAGGTEGRNLIAIGRLRDGASPAQVRDETTALLRRLDSERSSVALSTALVTSARRYAVEEAVQIFSTLLLGAAGFVLLAACANVGNLQIARSLRRQGEYGLRLALGAGRWRVVRLVLVESLAQSLLAAIAGVGLSMLALSLIRTSMPAEEAAEIGGWNSLALDGRALAYALGLALASAVLAAVLPALWLSGTHLGRFLRGGIGASLARRRHRTRNVLVSAQVALTLVLIAGAVIMVDGFVSRLTVSEGLEPETLVTVQLHLKPLALDEVQTRDVANGVLQRLTALPQVRSAALSARIPFRRHPRATFAELRLPRTPGDPTDDAPYAMVQPVSRGYFRTMNLRLMAGRELGPQDGPTSTPVTVVSQTVARLLVPAGEGIGGAVGQMLHLGAAASTDPPLLVVGVVGDMRHFAIEPRVAYTCYRPDAQVTRPATNLVVRTTTDADAMIASIEREIRALRSGRIGHSIRTMKRVITDEMAGLAYMAVLLSVFAAVSAIFSTVGVYALMTWLVQERTREIGLRMALGANQPDVVRMITSDGARVTLAGVGLGLVGAGALSILLSSVIFGAGQADPLLLGGLGLALTAVTVAACHLPARRAAKVDPMVALRCE